MNLEYYVPKAQNFPGLNWLIFNASDTDQKKARSVFIKKFSEDKWAEFIQPLLDKGIMTIFHDPPNQWTLFYVNSVAQLVDGRHKDQWKKCEIGCGAWARAGTKLCDACAAAKGEK